MEMEVAAWHRLGLRVMLEPTATGQQGHRSRWEGKRYRPQHGGVARGLALQGLRKSAGRPLAFPCALRPVVVSLAIPPMAGPQGPCCAIRFVIEHHYPEGPKGGSSPCEVRYFGKRGKQVKKMRLVPAAKAFEIARQLQGPKGSTISVI